MRIYLVLIPLLLAPSLVAAQPEAITAGSLHRSLLEAASDTATMEVLGDLGGFYLNEDRDSALFYLEKALALAVSMNLKYQEAYFLTSLGIIHMQQEKFSKSLEHYLKAIHIMREPDIEKSMRYLPPELTPEKARLLTLSVSYDLIGLLNAYTGNWTDNFNNQIRNYREAMKYAVAANDKSLIAYITFHTGVAYLSQDKLDSAQLLLQDALSMFNDLKIKGGKGRVLKYMGDMHSKMENYDLAARTLAQAVPILAVTRDHLHRGLTYLSLSSVYANLKKNDSALYYAKESVKIFQQRKYPAWKRDAYNLLASHYDRIGKADSATVYIKLAKSLSDSLHVEERKNLLAFQDVLMEEQAKLEKLEKEEIEARGKSRVYLLTSGITIFMVIVFLLYRNNRQRKKTNELLRQRNEEIERALQQLKSTQSQLIQSEKMASLGELTAGIAHEIQNPLNFVNNFSEVNTELIGELKEAVTRGNLDAVKSIAVTLEENESKIVSHGKRADAIVKGMLQHSRKSSGLKETTDVNALCDEYLRLAYHGLRAKDKSFNAKFEIQLDPTLPKVNVVPQEIGRVVLNLINNAFYAVSEKAKQEAANYQPQVTVLTKNLGDKVEIRVSDNGPGVPESIKDKIFQPFFTTKPTGQGTGLGLSLSYDIIKSHAGELSVETPKDQGSVFLIHLPIIRSGQ